MRALITGAATGIGASTVSKLKTSGYEVVALDIAEPTNVDQWVSVDMSNTESIDSAVAQLSGNFDCMINNAGLPPRAGLEETILAVNYLGLVRFTQATLQFMNKNAAIVNTASRAGAMWRNNLEEVKALMKLSAPSELAEFIEAHNVDHIRAYNLSKEAVIVWTMAQTQKMIGLKLRMNSVSPAAVSTGILDDFAAAFGDKMTKNVERVGRPGTAEEIADLILFLCSNQSHWIKGQDLVIDGGMSALGQVDMLEL
ncbi:SDR family oxidoreductase [Granulosicoccus sp.]|nr:SDR family oxidoreductase [Granulosicoccus sp.]MDB4223890.1 SDR family oxidoreductase [Granulosicoccus sp.]